MSSSSSVLLITSRWTPFGVALANRLLSFSADHRKLFVLCPYFAEGVPRALVEQAERGTVRIEFGSHGNGRLVTKLVQQNQIRTVFLLVDDDECHLPNSDGIATRTRALVRPLCALLECLRQCDVPPTLCTVAHGQMPRESEFLGRFQTFINRYNSPEGQPCAVVKCASEASARFSSVYALLHAYSVSYRLNAQIVLIEQKLDNAQKRDKAAEFVMEIAEKKGEKMPIHSFKMDENCEERAEEEEELVIRCVPFARLLLYGTPSAMQKAHLPLRSLVPGGQLSVANRRPGLDTDEAVEEEIVDQGASHLVFVHGADEATRDAWEAGGPANLRDNVRVNLFNPWLLSNICDRFGIVFIEYDGEQNNFCKTNDKMPKNAADIQKSRYAVMRHFGEKLCQQKVHSG